MESNGEKERKLLKLKVFHVTEEDLEFCKIIQEKNHPPYDHSISIHNIYNNKMPSLRSSEWIYDTLDKLRENATKAELAVCGFLTKNGVRFCFQKMFSIDGHLYYADIFLYEKQAIIEVDGRGHYFGEQKEHDKERDHLFSLIGIRTIRIPNDVALDEEKLKKELRSEGVLQKKTQRLYCRAVIRPRKD